MKSIASHYSRSHGKGGSGVGLGWDPRGRARPKTLSIVLESEGWAGDHEVFLALMAQRAFLNA